MEALFLLILWFVMYFAPTIIAYYRGHTSKHAIFFWNAILGWTFVGWLICFGKAIGNKGQSVIVNVSNYNGSNHKGN